MTRYSLRDEPTPKGTPGLMVSSWDTERGKLELQAHGDGILELIRAADGALLAQIDADGAVQWTDESSRYGAYWEHAWEPRLLARRAEHLRATS